MEDLCGRLHKLIHKELRSQYLDNLTYKDIRNIGRKTHKASSSQHILKNLMFIGPCIIAIVDE